MSEIRDSLRNILVSLADGVGSGNTNLSEDEMAFLTDTLRAYTDDKITFFTD